MKVFLDHRHTLAAVTPPDLSAYLRWGGWEQRTVNPGRYAVWTRGEEFELTVPLTRDIRDFEARIADVLRTLEVVESRAGNLILKDLLTSSADVLRTAVLDRDADSGTLPLEDGVSLVERARDLLLVAACSSLEPRAVYGRRKPSKAMDFVRSVRLGQTEQGSYVITIISPVNPELRTESPLVEAPFERRVLETLANGLSLACRAAEDASLSGSLDAFEAAVPGGVSANLCEAIVGIAGGQEKSRSVQFDFLWSRNRSTIPSVSSKVQIDSEMMPVLSEASRVLRELTPLNDFELVGTVVKLERAEASSIGRATVLGFVESGLRRVMLELDPVDYSKAVRAHDRKAPIRCVGTLEKDGRGYVLRALREFRIVAEEDVA